MEWISVSRQTSTFAIKKTDQQPLLSSTVTITCIPKHLVRKNGAVKWTDLEQIRRCLFADSAMIKRLVLISAWERTGQPETGCFFPQMPGEDHLTQTSKTLLRRILGGPLKHKLNAG